MKSTKPDPDVFLEAATRLGVQLNNCVVVGDGVWDLPAARHMKELGVGGLSGGYGEAELTQAGAYRVYKHPADLLEHTAKIGIQRTFYLRSLPFIFDVPRPPSQSKRFWLLPGCLLLSGTQSVPPEFLIAREIPTGRRKSLRLPALQFPQTRAPAE